MVALIAARAGVAAMRTGAEHVAVGQEAPVGRREHLSRGACFDQPGVIEPTIEVLRQRMIVRRAGAAEMIEGEAEAPVDVGLDGVLRGAERADILSGLDGAELGRRAVLVGGADEEHVVTDLAAEAGVDVGGQQRADQIAEMLDAVHIGKGAGDENFGHGLGSFAFGAADPQEKFRRNQIGQSKSPPA
ncbi:hypothetical protein ACVIST_001096 [Bradyrhizobium elkanii]